MSFDPPVALPAGYVTGQAIAYTTTADHAVLVSQAAPLPVAASFAASTVAAAIGTTTTSGPVAAFVPELGRPIWLTLSGSWTGSVRLLRSTDGGATKLPLTYADGSPRGSWTGVVNAAVAEESCAGASYHLDATLASGTLSYRLAQ